MEGKTGTTRRGKDFLLRKRGKKPSECCCDAETWENQKLRSLNRDSRGGITGNGSEVRGRLQSGRIGDCDSWSNREMRGKPKGLKMVNLFCEGNSCRETEEARVAKSQRGGEKK